MRLALPSGDGTGWEVCGANLEHEFNFLSPLPDSITLHAITGPDFAVLRPELWNKYNVGLCFIEDNRTAYDHIEKARFDLILAGSKWNALWLKGITALSPEVSVEARCVAVGTFVQGIDPIFHFRARRRDGLFVVFSGGKAEYRKGTDLVIWAMSRFMQTHKNVWLSAAWDNPWRFSLDTLALSPHIKYVQHATCRETLLATLEANRVPLDRVVLHPPLSNRCMPGIYWDSDFGLFPNRCEAGNNMVLSEYMASGRATAATYAHGHKDVIKHEWAEQHLTELQPDSNYTAGDWVEPSKEEILDKLEAAYGQEQDMLDAVGFENSRWMEQFTWKACAESIRRQIVEALGL